MVIQQVVQVLQEHQVRGGSAGTIRYLRCLQEQAVLVKQAVLQVLVAQAVLKVQVGNAGTSGSK